MTNDQVALMIAAQMYSSYSDNKIFLEAARIAAVLDAGLENYNVRKTD